MAKLGTAQIAAAKKAPQRVLNRIGNLNYFHDSRHAVRRNEIRWLVEEFTEIPLRNLPAAFEGFTIVQLTDMHLKPFTQLEHIQRAVERVNLLRPDLIVLTGDYVWHDEKDILDLVPALAKLESVCGIYAALGNHDIKTDARLITDTFTQFDITVLRNQGLDITIAGKSIYLAGIDDGWLGEPDIQKTLSGHSGDKPVV